MSLQVLRPHEPVAERVLLPGDPGRALRLAQRLLDAPRMLNHHRGLWGYSGPGPDGAPLTIQSTGLGGPSLALVVADLLALGARRLVRVGTCRAAAPLGSLVLVEAALGGDGTSRALGARERVEPDGDLLGALRLAAPDAAVRPVASGDLPGGDDPPSDLSTAALLTLARARGVAAAAVLLVTSAGEGRLEGEALERGEARLGEAGWAAVSARAPG